MMNDCENCRHINFLGLPDWSTMPCAVCARYGADNDPTMWEAKPQTNYDRIISKTPEELAVWLAQQEYRRPRFDGWLPLCNHVMGPRTCHKDGCEKCWLDWLRQEEGK